MRFVRGFGAFWYDFIIGDDWKIAVSVVASLAVACLVLVAGAAHLVVLVIGALALFAAFTGTLLLDARIQPPRGDDEHLPDRLPHP